MVAQNPQLMGHRFRRPYLYEVYQGLKGPYVEERPLTSVTPPESGNFDKHCFSEQFTALCENCSTMFVSAKKITNCPKCQAAL